MYNVAEIGQKYNSLRRLRFVRRAIVLLAWCRRCRGGGGFAVAALMRGSGGFASEVTVRLRKKVLPTNGDKVRKFAFFIGF